MHLNTLEILKALCILILPQIIFQLMNKGKLYVSEDDGALNEKNELYLIIIKYIKMNITIYMNASL